MHPTLTCSEDASTTYKLHLILHLSWSHQRAATCQGFPAHETPAARHLFHVGEGLATSLATDPSIASCTITLHCFMTPKAQSAIPTSRKTAVSRVLLFRFQ